MTTIYIVSSELTFIYERKKKNHHTYILNARKSFRMTDVYCCFCNLIVILLIRWPLFPQKIKIKIKKRVTHKRVFVIQQKYFASARDVAHLPLSILYRMHKDACRGIHRGAEKPHFKLHLSHSVSFSASPILSERKVCKAASERDR